MELLILYLVIINAVSFTIMLIDKYRAQKNVWRISEAALMTVAAVGGSLGALLGMCAVRHKIRKPKFAVGIPLLLLLHILLFTLLCVK